MTTALPILKSVDGFTVTGLQLQTINSDESFPATAKIPGLWQQYFRSDLVGSNDTYGVYSDYVSDVNGYYTVTAGIKDYKGANHYQSITIQAGNFLVFEGTGSIPATVIATWQKVWDYFAKDSEYRRNYINDFEVYIGAERVAVYIGIE